MIRRSGFFLTTLLLLAASLHAQASLAPGTWVKLPGIVSGEPAEIQGGVASSASSAFVVPLDAITRLAISRGHGLRPLTGALYGGLGGLALGFTVLTALCGEQDVELGPGEGDKNSCTSSDFGAILVLTSILGVAGAVGGLVVGTVATLVSGEYRQPMPTDRWRISMRPGVDGETGVGLTFSF